MLLTRPMEGLSRGHEARAELAHSADGART